MFRPVPTTEKMALAIIHQVMKPAFFVQHVMITCRSIMNIPRQKNVILWGSKASHDCKVQIDTLLPKKCFHWHLPRKHFHNSQVMQKSRELPPSDALVKVLDENERDMGIMPFKKLELLARKEQKQFVHLRNTKHKPSRHQVFILLSNNAVSQNPNDHTVDGKITNRKSLQLELKTKITDHDLGHKMRKAQQWIAKGHSVEILIIKKDENVKAITELIRKITDATKDTARVSHTKVNLEKNVTSRIHLKPIMEPETSTDKLKPLKFETMKKEKN